jgi:Mg-chelatase subunit ChlD
MLKRLRSHAGALPIIGLIVAAACDSTGPDLPNIEELTVSGIRVDADRFQSTGEFELGLLAVDENGSSILNEEVEVSAALTSSGTYAISYRSLTSRRPGSNATSAAILLDDSGSMSSNDNQKLRADAAELFWEAVLPVRSNNRVALLDFGAGGSDGFNYTRLLQTWTRDTQLLTTALGQIAAVGGTPLYESIQEAVGWVDESSDPASYDRVMLVLTDGVPGSFFYKEDAIAAALDASVVMHTVGLGPASDISTGADPQAVGAVRELAERTGGVYSAATGADALQPIFQTLAKVSSEGQLVGAFQISPTPPSGTRIDGTVTVTSGSGSETASWSFVSP